jgi:hypothetical protein
MGTHLTINQLEKMKTHELADMLANVVLLLRRMPDVECKQLLQPVPDNHNGDSSPVVHISAPLAPYSRDELKKMKVDDLKILAKELNVFFTARPKKDELIDGILAKAANGRSEQRALLDML